MKKILVGLLVLLIALAGLGYYFIWDGKVTPGAELAIDLTRIRTLANEVGGTKPSEIRVEKVLTFKVPSTLAVAGSGFETITMGVYSYKLVAGDQFMLVDTGFDEEMGAVANPDFYADAYGRMQTAIDEAALIVLTHEHPDHIGGLIKTDDPADALSRTLLTDEQVNAVEAVRPRFSDELEANLKGFTYDEMTAVWPGVVLIKSAGHSPGSQMVFVQTENGQEYLFIGDIAWQMKGVETLTERPRAVSKFLLHNEDRKAVAAQLQFLNDLATREPDLIIVAGHDEGQINTYLRRALMIDGF